MILLQNLFNHATQELKSLLYVIHYGLGRHYKIQAVKPKPDMAYFDLAMEGKAIMFTIQQLSGSMHLRTNNDISQVFLWFYERAENADIQTINYGRYDIFVLMKKQEKPIEIVAEPEPEIIQEPEPEITETPQNEEGI